jgi:hypothetical protein
MKNDEIKWQHCSKNMFASMDLANVIAGSSVRMISGTSKLSVYNVLDTINIKDIENYLRIKKLENINKK